MNVWHYIIVLAVLIVLGFIREYFRIKQMTSQLELATEFLNKFIEWVNGNKENYELYNWLTIKSEIVQRMLGHIGRISFRAPFGLYTSQNYPVIINAIPEIMRGGGNAWGCDSLTYAQTVDNCLRRFIGLNQECLENQRKRLFNPVGLLCGGIAWILEFPFYILSECKIIGEASRLKIINGKVFSFISGLTALLTLLSVIMGIIMGWENFIKALQVLLTRYIP